MFNSKLIAAFIVGVVFAREIRSVISRVVNTISSVVTDIFDSLKNLLE